jgi:hypothetical protein
MNQPETWVILFLVVLVAAVVIYLLFLPRN